MIIINSIICITYVEEKHFFQILEREKLCKPVNINHYTPHLFLLILYLAMFNKSNFILVSKQRFFISILWIYWN